MSKPKSIFGQNKTLKQLQKETSLSKDKVIWFIDGLLEGAEEHRIYLIDNDDRSSASFWVNKALIDTYTYFKNAIEDGAFDK